jgi:glycosyltransferase involved in cell wall biosynthesis
VGPDKGDGTLAAAHAEVERRNLRRHVRLLGAVSKEQVPACLNQADIFLNTTNFDNTPVSVLEAMACGLCVVSTNVGGIPYLLDHEQDSLLVPAGDAEACAGAVSRLLSDAGLAARISEGARRKAAASDWERVVPEWQRVLSNVLAARTGPAPLVSRAAAGD